MQTKLSLETITYIPLQVICDVVLPLGSHLITKYTDHLLRTEHFPGYWLWRCSQRDTIPYLQSMGSLLGQFLYKVYGFFRLIKVFRFRVNNGLLLTFATYLESKLTSLSCFLHLYMWIEIPIFQDCCEHKMRRC